MRTPLTIIALLPFLLLPSTIPSAAGPRQGERRVTAQRASVQHGFTQRLIAHSAETAAPALRSPGGTRRIRITENRGQVVDMDANTRPDILYHANAGGTQLYFTRSGISFVFVREARNGVSEATSRSLKTGGGGEDPLATAEPRWTEVVRMEMQFAGANPSPEIVTEERLEGYTNYYYAHCPDGVTNVPSYGRVTYRDIYDNIDFVFTTDVGRCKYEFVVHPGGQIEDIRLRYSGARDLAFTPDGGLEITAAFGGVREQTPVTYQEEGKEIPSAFMLNGNEVGFMVGAYDPSQDLVIDPWASYFGAAGEEAFYGVKCDNVGNIVASGESSSLMYPVHNGAQSTLAGSYDAVVTKFNSNMSVLLWSTYYGGSALDALHSIAIDSQGGIVLIGGTESVNLPTALAFQTANGGFFDVFLLKLTSGGVRVWATYLGGTQNDGMSMGGGPEIQDRSGGGQAVAFDASDQLYVYMRSGSPNLPTTPGAYQPSYAGIFDNYLAKFAGTGTGPPWLSWATYFGGTQRDDCGDMTLTPQGTIAIVGMTNTPNFPLLHPFQSTHSQVPPWSLYDGFLAEFTTSGTLIWSTYLGGSGHDEIKGIVADAQGALYVATWTDSDTLPVPNAYQPVMRGLDIYLCKFGPQPAPGTGRPLVWATYFGGGNREIPTYHSLALSGSRLFVSGGTNSTNLPLRYPMQAAYGGGSSDMLLAAFTTDGGLDWSTYIGGSDGDVGYAISFPAPDIGVLCGYTKSADFPVVGAYQMSNAGGIDAALLAFDTGQSPPTPPAPPTNMTATAESPTRIAVSWRDNADSESRYVLEYQVGSGPWTLLVVLAANAEHTVVRNLTPQTTYRFRVKAANSLYESVWSNTAEATTPAFPGPTNLRVVQVSIDEAELAWTDNSSNETAFIVEYMPVGGGWQPWDTLQADAQAAVVTGLTPSTQYFFRVKAVEDAAASPYSNTANATTADLASPSELEATALSSEEVRLRWKDNTIYESFYIVSLQQAGGVWIERDTVSADVTEWIVAGLSSDTEYWFRVKAVRGTYPSAWSNTAQARTLLYLPAPGTLTATLVGAAEARLDWADKSSGESGFEIERRLEGEDWQLLLTTAADVVTYMAGGLLPDTTYAFRVRAVGPNAASAWTNVATVGTFAPPLAPVALIATPTGHRSVRVTWQRGSANEMLFDVERKSGTDDWILVRTVNRGVFSHDDDGLQPATTYTYRVRAVNSRGASPWSAQDTATTYALPVPLRPIGLTAAAASSSSIRLTWGAPSPQYQSGFEIQESRTLNEADFARITPDAAANATTYTRGGLTANTTYHYRIRSFNASGASEWSAIATATTLDRDPNLPEDPFNAQATALGMSEIRVTWEMPTGSKEDGFEIEMSATGPDSDFNPLGPNPAKGAREFTAAGLAANTAYWFRVRAVNTFGHSAYSNVASATTQREPMSGRLSAALQAKEALFPGLENLIGAGDAEMAALRGLFGDHPRGYDETPAKALIAGWRSVYPDAQDRAADAMERFTLFEQALASAYHDAAFNPPVEGAREIARQASGAPGMLAKNACALALAWTAQRSALGKDDPYVDAAVEDLLLPVADGAQLLFGLMGAWSDVAVSDFAASAIRTRGAVPGLSSRALLSVLDYWQDRMAGRHFFAATQPTIARFADACGQLDIGDTRQSAVAKRDGFVLAVRDRTNALLMGYTSYARICTGMDAAYAIGQTLAPTREIFLQRMVQLRPRIVDGLWAAVATADIPAERFLYLTSTADIPGLNPLPFALGKTGNEIFHPERPGTPGGSEGGVPSESSADQRNRIDASFMSTMAADPEIDADRAALVALRERVVAGDASYVLAHFDALRAGGRGMTAAVARVERPLLVIAPLSLYGQTALQAEVYGALARSVLLRTRRTVLSAALADYGLAPTAQKQVALVAEIDSIIGPLDEVLSGLEDLKSGQAGSLITLPALALSTAEIVRAEGAGPTKYRLRFTLANVGGSAASAPQAELSLLTAGVTAEGAAVFNFGDLAAGASVGDSLALDVPALVTSVTVAAQLRANGRVFTERRTLPVPQATNATENAVPLPAAIVLHQNHPNPFRPVTTIGYTLPRAAAVTLVVTDLLGREVARLADGERRAAGMHRVTFDGRSLPAGLYLYRLETEGMVLLRSMLLLR